MAVGGSQPPRACRLPQRSRDARRRPLAGERARRDRRRAAVGRRRKLVARDRPRDQGRGEGARVRRGGPMLTYGEYGGGFRPPDPHPAADPLLVRRAAAVCAGFGCDCVVYMGAEDMRRQRPNVERMYLLGAEVRPVEFGTKTLQEATSEAIRDWITNVETTHYLIGSCGGPRRPPAIVRELQAVIGRETREQILAAEGRLPDAVLACVGGGSNAIGMFAGFLDDAEVEIVGVEAAGARGP